jgi:hypothetical protein
MKKIILIVMLILITVSYGITLRQRWHNDRISRNAVGVWNRTGGALIEVGAAGATKEK